MSGYKMSCVWFVTPLNRRECDVKGCEGDLNRFERCEMPRGIYLGCTLLHLRFVHMKWAVTLYSHEVGGYTVATTPEGSVNYPKSNSD